MLVRNIGDYVYTDYPETKEDRILGSFLSGAIGDLFLDSEEDTPTDQWTAVARCLRVHGLKITESE